MIIDEILRIWEIMMATIKAVIKIIMDFIRDLLEWNEYSAAFPLAFPIWYDLLGWKEESVAFPLAFPIWYVENDVGIS